MKLGSSKPNIQEAITITLLDLNSFRIYAPHLHQLHINHGCNTPFREIEL